ncbi:MAG: phosphoribosylamine--glycine ligase [Actinomycetota bacterium]|nr:phosphoribosylamine--glycine ligase [Actinomycetota bacterium]
MRVLVVGGGGREHAIVSALGRSPRVDEILCTPGNGGTATEPRVRNVSASGAGGSGVDALVELAVAERVDLAVIGPEDPLVDGAVDRLVAAGVPAFGPVAAAARLEGSKSWSKAAMERWAIPTAASATFTDPEAAIAHLRAHDGMPPVVKASGLAAGKGVVVADTLADAEDAVRACLVEGRFGDAGREVVIEERLVGPEVSVLAFCDGTDVVVMPPAQDHKRLGDADAGPNTGGMGAFVPSPIVDDDVVAEVERTVLRPVLDGFAAEGTPYVGVLYAGLMLTAAGLRVLEFNCRFGDPETQAVLPLLESDLVDVIEACLAGRLAATEVRWSTDASAAVVMASGGYPGSYPTGLEISGIDAAVGPDRVVFHAGTRRVGDRLETSGGRVLAVSATGRVLAEAVRSAYEGVDQISFEGAVWRRDIGIPGVTT